MPAPARPAREMLMEPAALWARFDAGWYRATYADALGEHAPADAELAEWYLAHGQARGHSPNVWFDEDWYRIRYPDVAALIAAGEATSGFDTYCRGGYRTRSPHWLFDLATYQAHSPSLSLDTLLQADFYGHYDHFLKHGAAELRQAHLLFDAATYLAALPEPARPAAQRIGPWRHYVAGLRGAPAELPTSLYFRPDWYRAHYADAAAQIEQGSVAGALHHYLTNAAPTAYNPLDAFDEAYYLRRYPDIRDAVRSGDRRNGYAHFLADGAAELRQPAAHLDLRYYLDNNPIVSRDLQAGRAPNAFAHYLMIGAAAGLPAAPAAADGLPKEAEGKAAFRARAHLLSAALAHAPLDFTCTEDAAFSAVLVLRDQFPLTLQALASLRHSYAGDIELVLADSGSTDETMHLRRYVTGARLLRFDLNIGYVRACNATLYSVTAPYVLFLNNDIELAPGAVAAALRRLDNDPTVGAVGGRIVRPHGLLQEAGCIVWRDGSTAGYLRDAHPLAPEAGFVRTVDYCSAAFLMVRNDLLQRLEGFDTDYAPAYFEDADLCLRIAAAGYRVVYDPAIVVHHLEYGSSTEADATAQMQASRAVFIQKHAEALARHAAPDRANLLAARCRDAGRRLLFIEDTIPVRRLGSGFVRANDIIHVIAEAGLHVTVFPINGIQTDLMAALSDLPDTVEIMHDQTIDTLPTFLAQRPDYYDTVWIARTHNLNRTLDVMAEWLAGMRPRPRIVLDTEAVASLRQAEQALLAGDTAFSVTAALAEEFRHAGTCDAFVAVTEQEAETLRGIGLSPVSVIGHVRELALTPRPYAERNGMLFVGAIHTMDSPNYDSLCWFIDEVLPHIEAELGWETRLTVIGHTAPGVSLDRFADHARVTLRGAVPDVRPAYDSHRLFVAPTRFAAGAAYKVHEAASFGLPVVASDLIAGQLGWDDGQDLLSVSTADPAAFAAAVLRVYRSPELWEHLRGGAAARIVAENERQSYAAALRDVLALPGPDAANVTAFPRPLRAEPL